MVCYNNCAYGRMPLFVSPHSNFWTRCVLSPKLERETKVWKTVREEDQEPCCKHSDGECSGNPTGQSFLALHLPQLQAEFQPRLAPFYKAISMSLKTSTCRNQASSVQDSINYISSAAIQAESNSKEVKGFVFSFPLCSSTLQQGVSCLSCHGGGREAAKTIVMTAYDLPSAALIPVWEIYVGITLPKGRASLWALPLDPHVCVGMMPISSLSPDQSSASELETQDYKGLFFSSFSPLGEILLDTIQATLKAVLWNVQ